MNREIAVWRDLRHPNVAELLGIATLIPGRPPGLVSRWVHRHNFMEYIGRHPDAKRGKVRLFANIFSSRSPLSHPSRLSRSLAGYNTCMSIISPMETLKWYVSFLLS